ncbi:MAG: ATP-binding protein [Lachnospiraceae bacterium]|nr:ATP-binding protein [Lachnospiraceae bacterium]
MEYISRIADRELDRRMQAFNAINIVGPKGCGKTRTARERCKTIIEFQDEEKREGYISIADTAPGLLLKYEKPILFDEWQDAPKVWGAIRKDCDDRPEATGEYFLTGSTSQKATTPHTGTGRISELMLYPMTLFETGDSNGLVSLSRLVEEKGYDIDGAKAKLGLEDLFYCVCRGGWPRTLAIRNDQAKLEVAKDYFRQIYMKDISAVDGVRRNSQWGRTLLLSYARNMATLVKRKVIFADVQATQQVSDVTLLSYIEVLESLFVIKDIDAWMPQIRSKTAIRAGKKRIFLDPSIGIAALGIGPEYFYKDLDTFGHAFENMVIRDLLAYAQAHDASILHYRDDNGLEADAVYQMADGRYALIEIKTGANAIPAAESSLLKFGQLIEAHNEAVLKDEKHPGIPYRQPEALIIICANIPMAYTTPNGVKVVPVSCLQD